MAQRYERLGVVPLEPVLESIRARMAYRNDPVNVPRAPGLVTFHGVNVWVGGLRMQTFAAHPPECADPKCRCRATHFAVERALDRKGNPLRATYHLNLYGRDAKGREVLFTHDHVVARSLGGADDLTNTQTMCGPCNWQKSRWEHADLRQRRHQAGLNPHTGDVWDEHETLDLNGTRNRKLIKMFETLARLRGLDEGDYRHQCNSPSPAAIPTAPFMTTEERQAAVLGLSMAGLNVFLHHKNQYQRHFNQAFKALKSQPMQEGQPLPFRDALFEHLVTLAADSHQPLDIFRAHLEAGAAIQFAAYDPATPRSRKHVDQASRLGLSNSALDFFRQAYPRPLRAEITSLVLSSDPGTLPVEPVASEQSVRRRRQP